MSTESHAGRQWHRLCPVEDLNAGTVVGRLIGDSGQDRDRVCIAAGEDGAIVAMLDRCPHRDVSLSSGVVKDGTLVCPGHFWRFDLTTGARTDLPQLTATVYPTRVVDGWVEALVPDPAAPVPVRVWLLQRARDGST